MQRYVPFIAVAAANMVNIPLMRQNELAGGIALTDQNGNYAGQSKVNLWSCLIYQRYGRQTDTIFSFVAHNI